MYRSELRHTSWILGSIAALLLAACTDEPEIHTCVVQDDCPAALSCLQQVCEAITLPSVQILNPEDGLVYPWMNDGSVHTETLSISATDLTLRPKAESSERVLGEGYLVVFVDEVEVATIDTGDLGGGVQMEISFEDSPGVHRLRVQARLHDGSDYDNLEGSARHLVWVDDGLEHVALRVPWPGEAFTLEEQLIDGEVAVMGGGAIMIGPSSTGLQHTFIYYDAEPFDMCLMDQLCFLDYEGIVPSEDDEFGPVLLSESDAGTFSMTATVVNFDHTFYMYTDEMGMQRYVHSSIEIERTDNFVAGQLRGRVRHWP
jgi:hypothetical protein